MLKPHGRDNLTEKGAGEQPQGGLWSSGKGCKQSQWTEDRMALSDSYQENSGGASVLHAELCGRPAFCKSVREGLFDREARASHTAPP